MKPRKKKECLLTNKPLKRYHHQLYVAFYIITPLSEASVSSEGTGVPGCSTSWFSSLVMVEAICSGDEGFAEDEEYVEVLLSN